MNIKLQLIIERVLAHHLDANIVSDEARSKIAKDISEIYFSSSQFLIPEGVPEEIADFYERKKNEK